MDFMLTCDGKLGCRLHLKKEQNVRFTQRISSKTPISGLSRLKCSFHVPVTHEGKDVDST